MLFDSAHLAAIGNILKGVKKDSIYLIDKVERVLPFAQKCMHSIPCLHKRLINFQGYLSEVPLFSPRGNFNQIQTPITNCSKKKNLVLHAVSYSALGDELRGSFQQAQEHLQ